MSNAEEIEKIKLQLGKANDNARALRDKLWKAEESEKLPDTKEKYEGKYFRYQNSYSGGTPKWYVYIFCREVISSSEGVFDRFETSPEECTFFHKKKGFYNLCEEQIPRTVYKDALRKFKAKVEEL